MDKGIKMCRSAAKLYRTFKKIKKNLKIIKYFEKYIIFFLLLKLIVYF